MSKEIQNKDGNQTKSTAVRTSTKIALGLLGVFNIVALLIYLLSASDRGEAVWACIFLVDLFAAFLASPVITASILLIIGAFYGMLQLL